MSGPIAASPAPASPPGPQPTVRRLLLLSIPTILIGVLSALSLRGLDLIKPPGAAEAIDWAGALDLLGAETVNGNAAYDTLGWAVKNREDVKRVEQALPELLAD